MVPTQMAIPLQMEIFQNSWSLQQERAQGHRRVRIL